ncbi:T9SS type A sorting domain-containing protein [Parabacteroides sp.]|uniref:T9SS type A sorting domain-containing protein n=1 Tax=Parabacteroides sp. TaxID=1869337 RepID=UPI00257A57AD|nr:T9SS type A sorting domain-containing protein [Parabacteroides sp.]
MRHTNIQNILPYLLFWFISVCGQAQETGNTQYTFNHYAGKFYQIANEKYKDGTPAEQDSIKKAYDLDQEKGWQQTHTFEKTIYVGTSGKKTITPFTPNENYYIRYVRWFTKNNEALPDYFSFSETLPESVQKYVTNAGTIFTRIKTEEVKYCYRANRELPTLDVSQVPNEGITLYADFGLEDATINDTDHTITEPTLGYRYIVHIKKGFANLGGDPPYRKYLATAGMYFQTRLILSREDFGLNPDNHEFLTVKYRKDNGEEVEVNRKDANRLIGLSNDRYFLFIKKPEVGTYYFDLTYEGQIKDRYEVEVHDYREMGMLKESDPDLKEGGDLYYQSEQFLTNTYTLRTRKNFDDYDRYLTSENDRPYSSMPGTWDQSSYAYYARDCDYGTYLISRTSEGGRYYGRGTFKDRRAIETNGTNPGFLIYVNACNEPGKMLDLEWNTICANSRMYVSAWVAECSGGESANLAFIFKGIKENGEEVVLNTYITGYVPGISNEEKAIHPKYNPDGSLFYDYYYNIRDWMHVYYTFTANFNPNDYSSFRLQIDNNASNSGGADFVLDQIRVFSSRASIRTDQDGPTCGNYAPIVIGLDYEALNTLFKDEERTVYYVFYDKDHNPITNVYGENENEQYGSMTFKVDYDKNPSKETSKPGEVFKYEKEGHKYLGISRELYTRNFIPGQPYTVTLFTEEPVEEAINGAFNDECKIQSEFTLLDNAIQIKIGDTNIENYGNICIGSSRTIDVSMSDFAGKELQTPFDWYFGSLTEFNAEGNDNNNKIDLGTALRLFRDFYPTKSSIDEKVIPNTSLENHFTQEMIDLLKQLSTTPRQEGSLLPKLTLAANRSLEIQFLQETTNIVLIPIQTKDDNNVLTCWNPTEFTIRAAEGAPNLNLGFYDITYPTFSDGKDKAIRIGLKDWTSGNTIEIPVRDPKVGTESKAVANNENRVYLIQTDHKLENNLPVGTVEDGTIGTNNGSQQKFRIKHTGNTLIQFKEGHKYRLCIPIKALENTTSSSACDQGDFCFWIYIVPEYQNWKGTATGNWNNDSNWERSAGNEIHKTDLLDDPSSDGTRNSFVPMTFTKVRIPKPETDQTGTGQVELYEAKANASNYRVLDLTSTKETTIGIPTLNIEYDIMADVKNESDSRQTITCRTYYTNNVEQIHFEPNTEMKNAHLLTYEKAWVDYELAPNRWYTLASPLQGIVAGDWYVPSANYRQETEYYQPIQFTADTHNRFNPAVFQRGWDKGNTAIRHDNASRENTQNTITANWSIVYNDVTVPYTPGQGFSLKVVPGNTTTDQALFRLPKADASYTYYNTDGTASNQAVTINRTNAGRLIDSQKSLSVSITNQAGDNPYFLIGNPFIAHLDMNRFFDLNTNVEKKYWIVKNDNQSVSVSTSEEWISTEGEGATAHLIAPLQSFFVKRTEQIHSTTPLNLSLSFTKDMQALGDDHSSLLRSSGEPTLSLTARRGDTYSHAIVAARMAATAGFKADEDAELLLDNSLQGVPMIYTVAGNQTATINASNSLANIPFGVYSPDGGDVTVTIRGQESFGTQVEVYDAVTRTSRPLNGNETEITVKGNVHGRYFLRSDFIPTGTEKIEAEEAGISIYSAIPGQVIVSSVEPLRRISVFDINGQRLRYLENLGNTTTTYINGLPAGIYVIRAESTHEPKTEKLKVK